MKITKLIIIDIIMYILLCIVIQSTTVYIDKLNNPEKGIRLALGNASLVYILFGLGFLIIPIVLNFTKLKMKIEIKLFLYFSYVLYFFYSIYNLFGLQTELILLIIFSPIFICYYLISNKINLL